MLDSRSILSVRVPSLLLLFLFGAGRSVIIALTGYGQNVTEYGVHWNFFFTLLILRLYVLAVPYPASIPVGIGVGMLYQVALRWSWLRWVGNFKNLDLIKPTKITHFSETLEEWLLRHEWDPPPRLGLLDENREGIFSMLGYISLYSMALLYTRLITPQLLKETKLTLKPVVYGLALALAAFLSQSALELTGIISQASRRAANAGYVLAMLALCQFSISGIQLINCLVPVYAGQSLMTAVSRNGLLFFLFANVLTGAINVSLIPSMQWAFVTRPVADSLVIAGYSLVLAVFAQCVDVYRGRKETK